MLVYAHVCAHGRVISFVPFGAGLPPLGTMPPIESLLSILTVDWAGTSPSSHCVSTATTASMALAATMSSAAMSTVVPAGAHANASTLCNLLPSVDLSAGFYVGEGLLPVPAQLAEEITQWEFVEMAELLPDHHWHQENPAPTLPLGRVHRGICGQSWTSQHGFSALRLTPA